MKLPRVPISDGAGEVVAVGSGVTDWKPGDRVVIPFFPAWLDGALTPAKASSALGGDVDGLLREFAVIRADALLPIPAHLSFEQAATLPCAALTAWNGLFVSAICGPVRRFFCRARAVFRSLDCNLAAWLVRRSF